MNEHLHSQADNQGRASRQLAMLAIFVLLSTLSFAGFAYDTSKLSDIQGRLDSATYVTVLAVTRYTALNSQDQHQLATAIIDLFAGGKNANISVENRNNQLLVTARARYQPAFVQYFGMASMEASSKSAGTSSLSPEDASIGLSQVLQSTADKSLVSELANLLLRFEKKNLDADEKLHEIQAANQTVINSTPENSNSSPSDPQILATRASLPHAAKISEISQRAPKPTISLANSDIVKKPNTAAKPDLQTSDTPYVAENSTADVKSPQNPNKLQKRPEPQSGFNKQDKQLGSSVNSRAESQTTRALNAKLEQGSGFDVFSTNRSLRTQNSRIPLAIDVRSLMSRNKQHSINTGAGSGFNLLDILAKSRTRKAIQKRSNFSWSALWRYMQKTYEKAPSAASGSVSTPSALAQFNAIIIELAFLVLLVTNLILWLMAFLSFRENHPKTDRENFNSRLQYIIAE